MSEPMCYTIATPTVSKCAQTLLILIGLSIVNETVGLRLTNMSAPAIADPRDDMNLDCHFDMGAEKLYAVKWYKDDQEFFRYQPYQQPHFMTYPVAGVHMIARAINCGESRCEIRLTNLTRDHSGGAYRCEVSSEAPTFRLASETHNITVAALPRENLKIEGLVTSYQNGDMLAAECSSAPADPSPILIWHINGQQAPSNMVGDSISSPPDKQGLATRSVSLRFQVERKYTQGNSIHLRCESSLPGITMPPQSVSQTVIVRSQAPQVNNEKLHWPGASNKPKLQINFILLFAVVRWLFI